MLDYFLIVIFPDLSLQGGKLGGSIKDSVKFEKVESEILLNLEVIDIFSKDFDCKILGLVSITLPPANYSVGLLI